MTKPLNIKEISARMVVLALSEHGETRENTLDGVKSVSTSGRLPSDRPASVRVSTDGTLIHVGLNVPGAGGLGIHFSLFADEATDERIERYLDHYLGLHEMAVLKFKQEREAQTV